MAAAVFEAQLSQKEEAASESWMSTLYSFGDVLRETMKVKMRSHLKREPDGYQFTKTGDWSSLPSAWNDNYLIVSKEIPGWKIFPSKRLNSGLRNAIKSIGGEEKEFHWVGIPKSCHEGEQDEQLEKVFQVYNTVPVYFSKEKKDMNDLFCEEVLFPIFHAQQPERCIREMMNDTWGAYVEINQKFATKIAKVVKEDDIVWIHDYHLMLVPGILRNLMPSLSIGFFFHVPFPTGEMFRILHVRDILLESVLNSDLVGFQTYNDFSNFSKTVEKILGLEQSVEGIITSNRIVKIGAYPIGIDIDEIRSKKLNSDARLILESLQKRYHGKKIVFSIEEMIKTSGTRQKLLAYELFLQRFPQWVGNIVFIQITLPVERQKKLASEIGEITQRINNAFGSFDYLPIVNFEREISFDHYVALLTVSDVVFVGNLRDGMSLVAHEYVVCKESSDGALILSEFSGASNVLSDAIRVNPWDISEVVLALDHVLLMCPEIKKKKMSNMLKTISANTSEDWINAFINDLKSLKKDRKKPQRLSVQVVEGIASKSCLIFIDVDMVYSYGRKPDLMILASIRKVVSIIKRKNKDNQIVLFSSMKVKTMEILFEGLEGVWICAENGGFLTNKEGETAIEVEESVKNHTTDWKSFTQTGEDDILLHRLAKASLSCSIDGRIGEGEFSWKKLISLDDISEWKDEIEVLLEYYTERTKLSKTEKRASGYVWHYKDSNIVFGEWQAKELKSHVQTLAKKYPLKINSGYGFVSIASKEVTMKKVVNAMLKKYPDHLIAAFAADESNTQDNMLSITKNLVSDLGRKGEIFCSIGVKEINREEGEYVVSCIDELLRILYLVFS
eukprot:GHVP01003845.1.p1 GENE.GHVP01003845.1~~GHVP01003845.1.p1  ORF type:complete len:878 (+),score=166.66 GHVP01003845.1:106-2634(+)